MGKITLFCPGSCKTSRISSPVSWFRVCEGSVKSGCGNSSTCHLRAHSYSHLTLVPQQRGSYTTDPDKETAAPGWGKQLLLHQYWCTL